ncbi:hypothetical protein C9E85_14730 [Plesiomonas shigelloides]|uniref:hypothetical protein n=1 Tax=Plesiomonas shigelloides TaxID=703 RepID=UPI000D56FC82|nr:hypothetical protein [Plesiomonas shigelloides]PVU65086.1 hypothetical protein C9E85_14730 [Plesiomonas shigelloides]
MLLSFSTFRATRLALLEALNKETTKENLLNECRTHSAIGEYTNQSIAAVLDQDQPLRHALTKKGIFL